MESLGGSQPRGGAPANGAGSVHRPSGPPPSPPLVEHPQRTPGQRRKWAHVQQMRAGLAAQEGTRDPRMLRPQSAPPPQQQQPRYDAQGDLVPQHGRQSLLDHAHGLPGPQVLRDLDPPRLGFPLRSSDEYLKAREGKDLRLRNNLKRWLARHPVNREPAFRKGMGGLRLSWQELPKPNTMFRYLYDIGTIDFVAVRWGGVQNSLVWGRPVRRGVMAWADEPYDVCVGKWLPIFLEGVREYEEPYRFLAIRGAEALIGEAARGTDGQLVECAHECVPPLRKALESREPTAVAVALELMLMVLRVESRVAGLWIRELWQFAQVMNLFMHSKSYQVNMGYNSREIQSVKALCHSVLIELEEHGGPDATALLRRYARVDPAVTQASFQQRTQAAREKQQELFGHGGKTWVPFTLF